MWETKLEFIRAGLLTLIQDAGRDGRQSFGVPMGGAMDTRSMKIGNQLVGNQNTDPILEISLSGPKIKTTGDAYIAITGATIDLKINDQIAPMYETLHVPSGSMIDLGRITNGARSYLAISGEWHVGRWLDSCSPVPIIDLKCLVSNQIKKGSLLTINTQKLISKRSCPSDLKYQYQEMPEIRILHGPEYQTLSQADQQYFSETAFTIHKNSNRMAVSMAESIPNYSAHMELISSANLIGTIQLTKKGQPLILMNDGGTTGGYPRIANVISADLPKIAQLKAGQKIKFKAVDLDFAVKAYKKEKELLHSTL